ncbi:MAG: type VI secretion system accessory protein TagJ [Candidatus Thiodiazotropha sp.]
MQAEELLQQGELEAALDALQQTIRKEPSNAKWRTFLFQLLCITGDWERALNQLKVSADLDSLGIPMAQTYHEAIRCELLRKEVFNGQHSPLIFGDPSQWAALLVEALRLTAQGEYAQADQLRQQAFDQAPVTSGQIDGQPFEWIADADPRIGPVLEAIVNGRYYWIPVQRLKQVTIDAPEDLRDLVWVPAHLTFENEGEAVALLPARYPGTETVQDNTLKLARKTEWQQLHEELYIGLGQRMLATDQDEFPLLGIRQIQFNSDAGTVTE